MSTSFRDFEHTGWDDVGVVTSYHRHLSELTTGCIAELVRLARLKPGQRALDVACGAGYVAAAVPSRELRPLVSTSPQHRFGWPNRPIPAYVSLKAMLRRCPSQIGASMLSSTPLGCLMSHIPTRWWLKPFAYSSPVDGSPMRPGARQPSA